MIDKAAAFMYYWRVCLNRLAPEPVAEYPFTHVIGRRHRFDFAFVEQKVAVEIEGNAWNVPGGGKHMTDRDLEKYNLAASMGWRVLRFSPGMLKRDPQGCVEIVLKTLEQH
jgi:very-short-patch-repair endonuclease